MVTPFWGLVVSSGRRIVRLVVVGGISTITGRRTPTASRPVTGEPIQQHSPICDLQGWRCKLGIKKIDS